MVWRLVVAHRLVAGNLNPRKDGRPIYRDDCVGADRAPLGHVVFDSGEWRGKTRGWTSTRFGSVAEAKAAVENHIGSIQPANLNRPQPMALAA